MSSIFTPTNLIPKNSDNSINDIYCMTAIKEESYFGRTLDFIIESKEEFNNASKALYKTILESNNDCEVITEGFGDFFAQVKKIIDKFIKFIKSLFERFITSLNSAFKNEKYLRKHKEDFKKFSSKNEFTFDGYEFTFSPSIPVVNALAEFTKEFIEIDFNELNEVTGDKRLKTISDKISNQYNDFINRLENDYYDYFRGRVIGKDGEPILQSDFANELFALYRNDSSIKESITVNNSYVKDAYDRFEKNESLQREVKKTKERIEKEYEAIKKQVEKMVYRNYDKDGTRMTAVINGPEGQNIPVFELNNEILTKIDLFIKAKANQVQEMSGIHALAFSAKLDAITDCFKQDKVVLYKALNKIQGTISEGAVIYISEKLYEEGDN